MVHQLDAWHALNLNHMSEIDVLSLKISLLMFFPMGLYIFESYMNLCPLRLVFLVNMQLYTGILTKCIVFPDINRKINAQ